MKKRLVIGDIHCNYNVVADVHRKENPDAVILLGDYCDGFDKTSKDTVTCWNNLQKLKKEHAGEFIMLLGNHDWHYINSLERYSGFSHSTFAAMHDALVDAFAKKELHVAYADVVNRTIYVHAGVTNTWLSEWSNPPVDMLDDVNRKALDFSMYNTDMYGNSKWQGPLWVRPEALLSDMYSDENGVWKQIVGHTHTEYPMFANKLGNNVYNIDEADLIVIDTLPRCYLIEEIDDSGMIVNREIRQI